MDFQQGPGAALTTWWEGWEGSQSDTYTGPVARCGGSQQWVWGQGKFSLLTGKMWTWVHMQTACRHCYRTPDLSWEHWVGEGDSGNRADSLFWMLLWGSGGTATGAQPAKPQNHSQIRGCEGKGRVCRTTSPVGGREGLKQGKELPTTCWDCWGSGDN